MASVVYFVQHPEDNYIKIGYTINLQWRLWALKCEYGVELALLGVEDGDRDTEHTLHRKFEQECRFGEWHRPSDRLLAYIAQHTRQVDVTPAPKPTPVERNEARLPVGVPVRRISSDGVERINHYDNFVMRCLSERFGDWRRINRSQVSRESGINPSAVGAWVRGRQVTAYTSTIQRWADYLGCTPDAIIDFAREKAA